MNASMIASRLPHGSPAWVRAHKCIAAFMKHGDKVKATRLFAEALALLHDRALPQRPPARAGGPSLGAQDPVLEVVFHAIEHVIPMVEVRKVRVAGNTLLVPAPVSPTQGESMAFRWIIQAARTRQHQHHTGFAACLADELWDAWHKRGAARHKRDELHRVAEQNRGYMRYRWW